ncbi:MULTISPECIES: Yip1 family protein [Bacillus]|uniref:Yip1 family protein n=1 Tax=Bacillus TaxID=1386 RepID=UPI0004135A19|nr:MULTISPECIES: Yip1 family protein [Bacillus]QHZ46622.1 YIP1 family protein [Bacillus sp. NSP9.1]WFA06755.1 Yip1 family protein [Bacillus sp. HSf4]
METNLEKHAVTKPSIFGVMTSPGVQFERIREKPSIWGPLFLVLVLTVIGAVLTAFGINYDAVLKETGLQSADELQIAKSLAIGLAIFGTIIFVLATIFIAPLIYWLCVKISGGETTYPKMLSMTLFMTFISSIGTLINGIFVYATHSSTAYNVTSLASLIPADQPLVNVLNLFEVFSIWSYVLLAIGLEKAGGISKKAAWISTAVLFGIVLLFSFLSGLLGAAGA